MGASSDLATIDVGRYDLLVGIGVRSPHVRAVMTRAVGAVSSVLQLTTEDVGVCAMPLLRQFTLGHRVVSHWQELGAQLAVALQRDVSCVSPPGDRWLGSPNYGAVSDELGVSPRYVLCAATERAVHEHLARGPFQTVVVDGATLESRRLDALVAKAAAVVIGDDAGDLAVVARRSGIPVLITEGSPGARWVAASASGRVFTKLSDLEPSAPLGLARRSEPPDSPGGEEPLLPAHVWARWYESHL
jgi:hypothetical protein